MFLASNLSGVDGTSTAIKTLSSHGLLSSDILLSHNNWPTPEDLTLLQASGAHISATPSTELQMGHGNPVCLEPGFFEQSSLGIDCHSACSAYIPSQMMLALQAARARRHEDFEMKGKWASSVGPNVEDVFNLGTILGAKAINMADTIGSLAKGKKADIVLFDGRTPNMIGVSARNPIAAIVLHSSIHDVSYVIVDGVIRKEAGKLLDVTAPQDLQASEINEQVYTWDHVADEIAKGAELFDQRKEQECDMPSAREGVIKGFHLNQANMADAV